MSNGDRPRVLLNRLRKPYVAEFGLVCLDRCGNLVMTEEKPGELAGVELADGDLVALPGAVAAVVVEGLVAPGLGAVDLERQVRGHEVLSVEADARDLRLGPAAELERQHRVGRDRVVAEQPQIGSASCRERVWQYV